MPESPDATASLYARMGGHPKIKDLLSKFYNQAGEDPVVGPIFAAAIHDWPHHIDHVADFWSTQTGGPALYPGGMGRHVRLGLEPQHFAAWLALWEKNCRAELAPREAEEMIHIAQLFAERLKIMTGNARPAGHGVMFHPRHV